jgi:hypothetical protein
MEACDRLDQFRKRGMDDSVQRSIVKKAFETENVERLKGGNRRRHSKFKPMMPIWRLLPQPVRQQPLAYLMLPFLQIFRQATSAVPAAFFLQQSRQQLDTVRMRRSMDAMESMS